MNKKYRNLRKAAVLVASLDEENADALLRQMSPAQVHTLREAMQELGPIDPQEQRETIEEFFRIGPLVSVKHATGLELNGERPPVTTRRHAAPASPRAEYVDGGAPFRFLQDASPGSLARILEREHPQTIAVVVSHLPPDRAAELLAGLTPELQIEVARRLVDLDETDPEILAEVERGLEAWLGTQLQSARRRTAGLTALDNILSAASPRAKQQILANLAGQDQPLVDTLKPSEPPPLSFAQLTAWDTRSLSAVIHHVEPELLVLALAGARVEFAERVYEMFGVDEGQALAEAVRGLGPTRLSDVEQAQHELAEMGRALLARGEVTPEVRGRLSIAV